MENLKPDFLRKKLIKKSYFGKEKWLRLSPYIRADTSVGLQDGLSRNYIENQVKTCYRSLFIEKI